MIVWEGRGILIILVLFASFCLAEYLLPSYCVDLVFVVSFFSTAFFSWHFGNLWNNRIRVAIDKETGEFLKIKSNHSLFDVSMQYWAFLLGFLGFLVLVHLFTKMWVMI